VAGLVFGLQSPSGNEMDLFQIDISQRGWIV
jgi:hypothetical protein